MTTITFNNANLSEFLTKFDVGVSGAYISLSVNSSEKLKLNYGVGEKQNRIVGNPEISAIKTKFVGNANYLVSEFKDTDALTIFTIAKRPSSALGGESVAFSNHDGGLAIGTGFFWYPKTGNISFGASRLTAEGGTVTSAMASISTYPLENWAFLCGETSSLIANTVTDLVNNKKYQSSYKTNRVVYENNNFCVGSSYYNSFNGEIDHFMTVAFNKLLSSEEKQIVEKSMRKLALSHGIIV